MPELGDHGTAGSALITHLFASAQNPHVLRIPAVSGNEINWRLHEDKKELAICFFIFFFKALKQ